MFFAGIATPVAISSSNHFQLTIRLQHSTRPYSTMTDGTEHIRFLCIRLPLHYNPPLLSVSILQIAIRRIYALLPCRLGTYDTSKTGYYRCLLCNLSPRDCWRRNGGRQEDHNSKVVVNCRYNALTATSPCSYWPLGIHKNGYLVPHLFNISINLEWLAECYDCKRLSSESKSLSAKY